VQERVRIRDGRRLTLVPRAALLLPAPLLDGFRRYPVLARSARPLAAALSGLTLAGLALPLALVLTALALLALALLALALLALALLALALHSLMLTLALPLAVLPGRALALAFALATLTLQPPLAVLPGRALALTFALESPTILLAGTALAEPGTALAEPGTTLAEAPGTAISAKGRSYGNTIEAAQALASNPLAAQFRANQHAIDDATDDGPGRDLAGIDVATILGEAGVGSREKGRDGYGRDQKGFQAGPPTSMPRQ